MKSASHQLFFILFTLFTISAAAIDILDRTQNITDGQTLVSPSGIFELGFFGSGLPTKRFLGIWYKVTPNVIVWVANRDRPLNDSSGVLAINDKGVLVLLDRSTNVIFSSNSSNAINPTVQLLDSGNLVLKAQSTTNDPSNNTFIWQSFDYPSNTMLPGMKVGKNLKTGFERSLSSWKSSDDPTRGDYTYSMDTQGSPELYMRNLGRPVYRTGPWNGLRFSGIPEMTTYENMFDFNFTASSEEITYGYGDKQGSSMSRVVLNETGDMQRLVWDQSTQSWNQFWSAPKDQCDFYAKCGPFAACNANDAMVCSCLKGFNPKSQAEWNMRLTAEGCQRRTQLNCSNGDGFYVLKGVKLPDTHNATADQSINLDRCGNKCAGDCSCTAYASADIREGGTGCVTWSGELTDLRYTDGGQDLYIKVAKSELDTSNTHKTHVVVIAAVTTISILLLLSVGFLFWRKRRAMRLVGRTFFLRDPELPAFDLETVMLATGNFSKANKIGEGGFGDVYKGKLQDGHEIAVKRLSENKYSSQGLKQFMNEVILIAKLQHRNLIRLLGYCSRGKERMLIYEYMSNKSLDFFIFDERRRTFLNWKMRLDIILGIARGVLYLHQESRVNIIHRDLKAANILLDGEMVPKISDFGTARLLRGDEPEINTQTVVGTRGYMSPEYAMDGKVSVKSDVYSFGVLLLEIISGERNEGHLLAYVSIRIIKQNAINLSNYTNSDIIFQAWNLWLEGNSHKLLDGAIGGPCPASEILRCIQVGLLCVQECPDDRPEMDSIVLMLASENIILSEPKKPVVCTSVGPLRNGVLNGMNESHSVNHLTITSLEGR
ncbi:receptor-like serine/threonine-protein kinase SD1-8 isoform X1 [Ananas comosus]|uniref:Receptor-like serine/threonine-protein kinase n=1 Tax=Ananas comosus TaxID=4615 RepID=A0A6P5GN15_ANACO|nr:receptor-like serine/threonine-protein kinase SD1-8 isoform X1 [Ananas comosus]